MIDKVQPRAAVSIKDMAAMVGLSRQRFMQLVKAGVFPPPLRDEASGRPYYTDEMQTVCLDVRRRNCGINGKVVMFYARRRPAPDATCRPKAAKPTAPKAGPTYRHADTLAGLHGLGLATATSAQVAEAVAFLFPQGTNGTDPGEVIRVIFLHLRGKNSAGKVGRKE
jgi:hypothetical protein